MDLINLLQVLPNLSIGVISVLALIYVTKTFIAEIKEREIAMRALEREVRTSITSQLSENTRVMERVLTLLNK